MTGRPNVVTYKDGSTRVVDPMVAKLKAARKAAEDAKAAASQSTKAGSRKAKLASKPTVSKVRGAAAPPKTRPRPAVKPAPLPTAPPALPEKKLNFAQLMREARKVDGANLKVTPIIRQRPAEPVIQRRGKNTQPSLDSASRPNPSATRPARAAPPRANVSRGNTPDQRSRSERPPKSHAPAPATSLPPLYSGVNSRRPAPAPRPASRSRYADSESDSVDDFIVSGEEEEEEVEYSQRGYDRDEIWKMFNRGKKREYYDDFSDDDMEATGAEVLMEESRSSRQAQEEDRRERDREARLAAEKAKRLKR